MKSQELKPAVSVVVMNTSSSINVVKKVRRTSKINEKKLTHKLKLEVHER